MNDAPIDELRDVRARDGNAETEAFGDRRLVEAFERDEDQGVGTSEIPRHAERFGEAAPVFDERALDRRVLVCGARFAWMYGAGLPGVGKRHDPLI